MEECSTLSELQVRTVQVEQGLSVAGVDVRAQMAQLLQQGSGVLQEMSAIQTQMAGMQAQITQQQAQISQMAMAPVNVTALADASTIADLQRRLSSAESALAAATAQILSVQANAARRQPHGAARCTARPLLSSH